MMTTRPRSLLRAALGVGDLLVSAMVVACTAVVAVLTRRAPRHPSDRRALLAFNTFYSLRVLRARRGEHTLTHRDLGGYYDHVWSVHPLVGADPEEFDESVIGEPAVTRLAERHTLIEGRIARTPRLDRLPMLNFALAQAQLFLRLNRLIAREGVRAISTWEPHYTGPMALALARLHGLPLQIRIASNYDDVYEAVGDLAYPRLLRWRRLEQALARFTLSRAQQVVVLSANNRTYAIRNGARDDLTVYAGNWSMIDPVHLVDPRDRTPYVDEFGLGERPFTVTVSRLERVKYPEDVLTVLAKARERYPQLGGLLIGEGSQRAELEAQARELGLEGHLFVVGGRDHEWVSRALAAATVVVAPMAGLTLTEAALSETPIVAYDYEWHAEFIQSDENGILVPYRDTDALAAAACELIADPERAARLGAAARASALARMHPDFLEAHERDLADRLLAASG